MENPIISSSLECDNYEQLLSSSSPQTYDAYNVAIALNNAGVTFIQNSCYILASESFRDALHVMKLATATTNENGQNVYEELSNKMANASKRLLERQHQKQQISERDNMNCPRLYHNNLSILKYDGTVSSISNAAVDTNVFDEDTSMTEPNESISNSMKQCFAIQIINIDHHLHPLYEIDTAIILYNYGIACHYYDSYNKDNVVSNNQSKQFFLLSYDLLNDDSNNENEHLMIIALLLSCLVTMSLFHIAMDFNNNPNPDEAFHYYLLINYMRHRYEILNNKHDNVVNVYHLFEFDNGQHHAASA